MQEAGIGTETKASDSEEGSKSETTTTANSRPATIPTIIQTDDSKRSEVSDTLSFPVAIDPYKLCITEKSTKSTLVLMSSFICS